MNITNNGLLNILFVTKLIINRLGTYLTHDVMLPSKSKYFYARINGI